MNLQNKVVYIFSKQLKEECNRLPTMLNRASIVHDLITSYDLFSYDKLIMVESLDATEEELKSFHSSTYIDFLKNVNSCEDFDQFDEEQAEFGLGYDCPILERNYDFIKTVAGGSLTAAKILSGKKCEIAINWFGGWHHAQRDAASGFCYVNDIVLAIQKLSESFKKILYLDLDIHHGDGVQNAFEYSKNVLTLSFHKLMPGFFPGTGKLEDVGSHKGTYCTINVPLLEGVSDASYLKIFSNVFPKVVSSFKPEALVVQCGADSLNGDELGQSNLTLNCLGKCIEFVLELKKPVLFCGGGGYNFANTARLWAFLTSVIIGVNLDEDIPDSSEYFTNYAPTYELHIDAGKQKDFNTDEYVNDVLATISCYCECLQNKV